MCDPVEAGRKAREVSKEICVTEPFSPKAFVVLGEFMTMEANTTTPSRPKIKPPTPGKPIMSGSDQDTGLQDNALLMGIDLGTSRSSIVSFNGARKTVESFV